MEPVTLGIAATGAIFSIGGAIIEAAGKNAEEQRRAKLLQKQAGKMKDIMSRYQPGSPEYQQALGNINTLYNSMGDKYQGMFQKYYAQTVKALDKSRDMKLENLEHQLKRAKKDLDFEERQYVEQQEKVVKQYRRAQSDNTQKAINNITRRRGGDLVQNVIGKANEQQMQFHAKMGEQYTGFKSNIIHRLGQIEDSFSNAVRQAQDLNDLNKLKLSTEVDRQHGERMAQLDFQQGQAVQNFRQQQAAAAAGAEAGAMQLGASAEEMGGRGFDWGSVIGTGLSSLAPLAAGGVGAALGGGGGVTSQFQQSLNQRMGATSPLASMPSTGISQQAGGVGGMMAGGSGIGQPYFNYFGSQ